MGKDRGICKFSARISMTQNNLQELKEIWAQWDDKVK
ncbi:hypothetical protein Gohar_021281 [Gossypium harknessii]|uniref:Uncharacterized protein n=1 Tax=Gossypium harknessii TaxID=34285 RepID=A0A7J9IBV0_9ROSI|nr:hypothetical protein [Gossypium harknessii]